MVSVGEAEKVIQAHLFNPAIENVSLKNSIEKILAEEIRADRDLPPFNRATMDGIAISFSSFEKGQTQFVIEGLQVAGQLQQILSDNNNCIEIMTGAPLPQGTDSVVPYENLKINDKVASILRESVFQNQNVHKKGSDAKQNEILLQPGLKLSSVEIAILASVGTSEVKIYKTPSAAVISTGDELVNVVQTPLPHQIRKSNSYAIVSELNKLGCKTESFHLKDDENDLATNLKSILEKFELIILSGGVSKGKLDFVPKVLETLGVKKLFHGVSQRPGKPMWFGVSDKNFVFALPGNPVSTFMCFHRYVKPWLRKSLREELKPKNAILASDFSFTPSLTYFLQVKIENENGKLMAYPDAGGGSGDFINLKDVDGFLELPKDHSEFSAGSVFPFFQFR
ncbi:MAG: molybdopterin molybdotransferase MoeA [Cyclobacteriaceae bacterium]